MSKSKTMTKDQLFQRIVAILHDTFGIDPGKVTPDSKLGEDLDIDSIDAVNLMIELKSITAKKITLENFHQVKTIGDLADAILDFLSQDAQGQAAN